MKVTMTNRRLPPSLAAPQLARLIFGEHRGYQRRGGVHVVEGELVVRTTVPEERWPANRATSFEGYLVRWEYVGK
jgi:hypothetical protein